MNILNVWVNLLCISTGGQYFQLTSLDARLVFSQTRKNESTYPLLVITDQAKKQ